MGIGRRQPARCGGIPRQVALDRELGVVQEQHAAGHPRGDVAASRPHDDDRATRHVLARVIRCPLHDGTRARVAHGESLANRASDEELAARCPVEACVARTMGHRRRFRERPNRDRATAHALPDVVIAHAVEIDVDAAGEECAEGLPRRSGEANGQVILAEAGITSDVGDLTRQPRAHRTVRVLDRVGDGSGALPSQHLPSHLGQVLAKRRPDDASEGPVLADVGPHQQGGEVRPDARVLGVQQVAAADDLLERPGPHRRQRATDILGDQSEQLHHLFDRARVLGSQVLPLGGDSHRARVLMALSDHLAPEGDQGQRAETVPVGAQQRGHHDVLAGPDPAVGLERDRSAEPVRHECLMGLGESDLPRGSRVLDRHERRCTRAATVARDRHTVRRCLGDPDRDRPHAGSRHQLHTHPGERFERLEVVDELRQVLDRVDVVVRWRRDQRDTRLGVTEPSDLR